MNKIIKNMSILLLVISLIIPTFAKEKTIYVNLETLEYSTDQKNYSSIKEYKSLEELKEENNLPNIYITNFLYDGVSSVKEYDLDDFIENNSNDTKVKTLEIKVININTTGNIEFTGEIKGAMIGVDTNQKKGEINLILNNASIDTDSKKAPAIYVYNKDKNNTDTKVTIKTVSGTKNYLEGGKLKKVSLVGSDELDNYTKYYSNETLENYKAYSSYYGVYTSDEIKNILFATVQADTEDLKDGDPYYFYKASGAVSSDIDLYFEGEGYLKVTSKGDEGIETKGNLTFSGGTGDYEIDAADDCLNTTTASSNNTTVRNDIVIDVDSLLAIVREDAEEGDAIDSNGKITINGGKIYAFANPNSGDAGIDSANGTYLNGGEIIATGNMADAISEESKQKYIYASFPSKIEKDTLIVIKDKNDNIITAFKTSRSISNLLYSSSNVKENNYKFYTGGTIEGEVTNGLYRNITDYSGGEEITFQDASQSRNRIQSNSISSLLLKVLLSEIVIFIGLVTSYILLNRKKNAE